MCSTWGVTGEGRHPDRVPLRDFALGLPARAIGSEVRRLDPPVPVRAWIPLPRQGWTQLDGQADAWTSLAAHVLYEDEHGRVGTVWVWANAVVRR